MTHQVLLVGSGFAAQSVAIRLKRAGITDFVIIERRPHAGGTWLNQRYPGAAVDVQSPLYSLYGEPYDWTEMFAPQAELAEYADHILDKHDLRKHIRLNTTVTGATWNAAESLWQVETSEGPLKARFLVNASGQLAQPVIPEFKGKDSFAGTSFHTAYWPDDLPLKGKRVALIGSGSSSAQIIPPVSEEAEALHVFQRTAHWVLPRPDHVFKPWQRRLLKNRFAYGALRQAIRWGLETRILAFKYSRFLRKLVGEREALNHLKKQVSDEALRAKLTPDFEIGCKRVILSSTVYPALQRENVTLHTGEGEGIAEITATGITRTDGTHVEADVIAFATGYDTTRGYLSYPVQGPEKTVAEHWAEHPTAYVGSSMSGFPNFFLMNGPYTAMAHSSALLMLEAQARYIIKSIAAAGTGTVEVTPEAETAYTEKLDAAAKGTVWETGGCDSWYLTPEGRLAGLYPGFAASFQLAASRFRAGDHRLT